MDEHRERPSKEPLRRAPYLTPRLGRLGSAATLTETVSTKGMMDGFMGRRTG